MRSSRKAAGEIFDNPILIGTITVGAIPAQVATVAGQSHLVG